MSEPIHIISLGAGVQSSTMALMAARGEITPMPTAAVFADTKCEPLHVYEWLKWLEGQLPFPVYRVVEGRGLLSNLARGLAQRRFASVPFFTESKSKRGKGKLRRQCTKEFKITPIHQKIRELAGLKARQVGPKRIIAFQWIGISLDEVTRMKQSRVRWMENIWPLIDRRMTRHDCLRWMEARGFPTPPRSACTFCPYHSDAEWARLKQDPRSWKQIVAIDVLIRGGTRGTKQKLFLHKSMRPISDVDFSTEEERGQINMFENECEGMCGV